MDDSMTGRVLVMDEGEKIEIDDIAIVMEGIEEVGTKSGESEQGITIKFLRVAMVMVEGEELRVKDSGVSLL